MDVLKLFRKCFVCGQKGTELRKTPLKVYGGTYNYHTVRFAYHPGCLKAVLCNPENYNNEIVDMAIKIANIIKDQKREEKRIQILMKKQRKENIKEAKILCKEF